jgi:hypothetical protein
MLLLGANPAEIAKWEAEHREAEAEEREDGTEPPPSRQQARRERQDHARFVRKALRAHFSPAGRRAIQAAIAEEHARTEASIAAFNASHPELQGREPTASGNLQFEPNPGGNRGSP